MVSSRLASVSLCSLAALTQCTYLADTSEHIAYELSLLQLRAQLRRSGGSDTQSTATSDEALSEVVIDSSLDEMLHSVVGAALAAAQDARATGADEITAALAAAETVTKEEAASLAGGGGAVQEESPGLPKVPSPALLEASSTPAASGDWPRLYEQHEEEEPVQKEPVQKMAALGSCGPDFPSNIHDCQRIDFGSCGNACCNLLITVPLKPSKVVELLNASLSNGGPDGRYHLESTIEGSAGFADLTDFAKGLPEPYRASTSGLFIGQVHHETVGHFNDSVNFNLLATKKGGTLLHAFSLSLVAGALGDNGQNFKNIISPVKDAFGDDGFKLEARLFDSCPDPNEVLIGPRISSSNSDLDMSAKLGALGVDKVAASAPDVASAIQVDERSSVADSTPMAASKDAVISAEEVVQSEREQDAVTEVPTASSASEETTASEEEVAKRSSARALDASTPLLAAESPPIVVEPASATAREQEQPSGLGVVAADVPVELMQAAEIEESQTAATVADASSTASQAEMPAQAQPEDVPSADEVVAAEAAMLETSVVSEAESGVEAVSPRQRIATVDNSLPSIAAEAIEAETPSVDVRAQSPGLLSRQAIEVATPSFADEEDEMEGNDDEHPPPTSQTAPSPAPSAPQAIEFANTTSRSVPSLHPRQLKLLTALLAISSERQPGHAAGNASAVSKAPEASPVAKLASWVAEAANGARAAVAQGVAGVEAAVGESLDEDERKLNKAKKEAKDHKAKLDRRDDEWHEAKAAADAVPEADTSDEEEVELSKKKEKDGKAIFAKKAKGSDGSVLAKKGKDQGDPILAAKLEKPEHKANSAQMREASVSEAVLPAAAPNDVESEGYVQLEEVQARVLEAANRSALASATLGRSGLYAFGLADVSGQGTEGSSATSDQSVQKRGQSGLYAFGTSDNPLKQELQTEQSAGNERSPASPAAHQRSEPYAFGEEGAVFDEFYEEVQKEDEEVQHAKLLGANDLDEKGVFEKEQSHVEPKEESNDEEEMEETQAQAIQTLKPSGDAVDHPKNPGHSAEGEKGDAQENKARSKSGLYEFGSDKSEYSEAKMEEPAKRLSKREVAVQKLHAKSKDAVSQLMKDAVDDALKAPAAKASTTSS